MKSQVESSNFGKNLREIRRDKGLTQSQLAELSGISSRMIVHYESYVKMPPLEKVKKIASALGVTSDELLGVPTPTKEQKKNAEASYRVMKRVRVIEKLPKREQDMIFNMLNMLAEKHGIKNKS